MKKLSDTGDLRKGEMCPMTKEVDSKKNQHENGANSDMLRSKVVRD